MAFPALQRADGGIELVLGPGGLRRLYQHDPCRVLFPHGDPGDPQTAVMVTTAGGLAGGDRIRLDIAIEAAAVATLTSQAAEKVYRSTGADTRVTVGLAVGAGAVLEWLPQETILFDGARFDRRIAATVEPGGRLLAAESLVLGRIARGERFLHGLLHDAWRVDVGGRLAWADALRLDHDIPAVLAHPAGFDGAVAVATVLAVGDGAASQVERARELLDAAECRAAVTCLGPMLVARFLGRDARRLRHDLARYLVGLRSGWLGLPARLPRLWHG